MKFTAVLTALLALSTSVSAGDWEHMQGPNFDGISTEKGLAAKGLKTVWEANVNTGFASITVSKGKIYTMGFANDEDHVYCLDAKTGKQLWVQTYKAKLQPNMYEGGPNATPTIANGKVYTLGKHGQIYCFDAKTGKKRWSFDAGSVGANSPSWGFSSAPTVIGKAVYYNVGDRGLALHADTGKPIWKSGGKGAGYGPLIPVKIGGRTLLALATAQSMMALSPKTGKAAWTLPWPASHGVNAVAPLQDGNIIFYSSGYNRGGGIINLKGTKASKGWYNNEMCNHFSNSYLIDGVIYGISGNSARRCNLKAMDLKSGDVKWSEGVLFGSMRYADGKFFILNERGKLTVAALSPSGYKELGSKQILNAKCWTAPTIANGMLYARDANGTLVCIDLKS